MAKAATIFTGFDGAGIGIKAAGFELAWGLELDDAIAQVARDNGHNVITGDILQADPHNFQPVDAIHASPPCTRASVANSSAEENEDGLKEAQLDIDLAMATVRFIEHLQPRIVTIENVWGYRKFQSFRGGKKCEGLLPALERMGYWIDVQHVNAADFGVPQSRRRLILRAVKGGMVPMLPEPEPWRGWYEAIEDLIPTLPESQFAPWQLERLPDEMRTMIFSQDYGTPNTVEERQLYTKEQAEPVFAIKAQGGPIRAFVVSPIDGLVRDHNEPSQTVVSSAKTVKPRAFLAGGNATHDNCTRLENEPAWTIGDVNRVGNISRAWLSHGKVVKMTLRALARFQSFPDSYELPTSNALACKGIGNACPPMLFKKLYLQLRDLL